MLEPLADLLNATEVTEPRECDGLQLFGLRHPRKATTTYRTMDEALAHRALEVTEISESGSVPVLRVVNKDEPLVFLMAGEHLIGAKQNRVLNTSVLMPGQAEVTLPVSCVEARRWHYCSPQFTTDEAVSHGALRKMMSFQAHDGYRRTGTPTSCQAEVWKEVGRKLGAMGSVSPTAALHQAYADHRQRLGAMLQRLPVPTDCAGVAFAVNGRIAGADWFDQPATLARLWPKLVRAYALDALEFQQTRARGVKRETVADWLRSAGTARAETYQSPGLGQDVRLEGPTLHGAGLVYNGSPVHVELFARDPDVKPAPTSQWPAPTPKKPSVLEWLRNFFISVFRDC
jgi:hypothetical protein